MSSPRNRSKTTGASSSILACQISEGGKVIIEVNGGVRNCAVMMKQALRYVRMESGSTSVLTAQGAFHFLVHEKLMYVALTPSDFDTGVAYDFLSAMREETMHILAALSTADLAAAKFSGKSVSSQHSIQALTHRATVQTSLETAIVDLLVKVNGSRARMSPRRHASGANLKRVALAEARHAEFAANAIMGADPDDLVTAIAAEWKKERQRAEERAALVEDREVRKPKEGRRKVEYTQPVVSEEESQLGEYSDCTIA